MSRTGEPLDARLTKFTFSRGKTFVGWTQVEDAFGTGTLQQDTDYHRRTPTVFTTCKPTVSNDNEVAAILERVEILAPQPADANTTWQDAFTP